MLYCVARLIRYARCNYLLLDKTTYYLILFETNFSKNSSKIYDPTVQFLQHPYICIFLYRTKYLMQHGLNFLRFLDLFFLHATNFQIIHYVILRLVNFSRTVLFLLSILPAYLL